MIKNDIETLRVQNVRKLVHSLRLNGPIARIDLGAASGLSAATVTAITARLLADGLIVENLEDSVRTGGKGRPKTLIDLNPKAGYVICARLSINELQLVVGDFKGRIVDSEVHHPNTLMLNEQSLLELLKEHIQALRQRADTLYRRFLGICVIVQGIVGGQRDHIVWSPAVACRNAPIGQPLAAQFGCPVVLENDSNCIGKALMTKPEFRGLKNMVVIMLGYGVGMAVFIDGRLYTGSSGSTAEFGHTKYQPDGPLCACGKRGCIEAYVSDYALYRDARAVLALPEADNFYPTEEQMQVLTRYARNGNLLARDLFDQAGRVLGVGLANVIALFNPELVVVTGVGVRGYAFMEAAIQTKLAEVLVRELIGRTRIRSCPWDDDLTGLGGIATAIEAAEPPWEPEAGGA
ncbi:MAG: ROK family protein [Pseudomonadota bacterium]|nr:ROK family protein [Pseudomonadota bacterium]